jgi:hypothetical protein
MHPYKTIAPVKKSQHSAQGRNPVPLRRAGGGKAAQWRDDRQKSPQTAENKPSEENQNQFHVYTFLRSRSLAKLNYPARNADSQELKS